jgi:ribonuclease D
VTKVLHGADYDVSILKRDFGVSFAGIFDTMIAARFLGRDEIGLQSVARSELGVELTKGSQRDDWSRRPLTDTQEAYALADVAHLLAIRARLADKLICAGRLEWVLEECQAVAELPAARRGRAPDAYLRIKGASRLSRRSLAVLRELDAWRESVAAARDRPAFRILSNETLLELATTPPRRRSDLARARTVVPRLKREIPAILAAVDRGLAEHELPSYPRRARATVNEATRRRAKALKAWRAEKAEELHLDVSVVLPQRLLDRVAEAGPRATADLEAIEGLRRWRVEAFGSEMMRVASADGA